MARNIINLDNTDVLASYKVIISDNYYIHLLILLGRSQNRHEFR